MSTRRQNPTELRRQAMQSVLDAARSAGERNRLGQFAIPYSLAVEIARYIKSVARGHLRTIHFADPSIGTSSSYSAALAVFGQERVESAVGVEIDPRFCDAARDLWTGTPSHPTSGFARCARQPRFLYG